MRILVCIKRVGLLAEDVEFTNDGSDVDPDYLDYALNEWDSCAVEEGLRIREAVGGEVLAVTVGGADAERELRRCLAMGADRAVRITIDSAPGPPDPITVASAMAETVSAESPDLVLCGVQSSDSVQGATGGALAGFLGLPCVAVARRIEYDAANRSALIHRELEGGLVDVTETSTPAVLAVQTGINQPRYVTLRAIQEAGDKDIEVRGARAGVPAAYRVKRMFVPTARRAEMIGADPGAIARRILEIAQESGVR